MPQFTSSSLVIHGKVGGDMKAMVYYASNVSIYQPLQKEENDCNKRGICIYRLKWLHKCAWFQIIPEP